jgi:hypothetical protein
MNKFRWAALALWLLAVPLHAQTTPSGDVSVQYSPLYVLKGYTVWMNGVSASVERNVINWLGLAGDFGVYRGHVPENLTGETYLVGPAGCESPATGETNSVIRRKCAASSTTGSPARPSSVPADSSCHVHSPDTLPDLPLPKCRRPQSNTLP